MWTLAFTFSYNLLFNDLKKTEYLHFLFLRVLLYLQICLLVTHDFKLSWIYWFLERYLSSSIYIWYLIILIFEVLWVQPITSFVHYVIFFVVVSDFFFFKPREIIWGLRWRWLPQGKNLPLLAVLGASWIWAVFNSKFRLCKQCDSGLQTYKRCHSGNNLSVIIFCEYSFRWTLSGPK